MILTLSVIEGIPVFAISPGINGPNALANWIVPSIGPSEGTVAVSSANPADAVIVTLMGVAYTTNHGNSWSQGASPSATADKAMVVSDTSGNFYVGTGYAGPVAKSTNNGISWTTQSGSIYSSSTAISLPGGGSGTPCVSSADFPSLSVDDSPNSVYKNNLYWFLYLPISIGGSCNNPYMVFFRSTDGGTTWKDGQAFSASVYATDPMAVTNNGTLFIANENNAALYIYKSTDGGHSFSSTKLFSDSGLNSGPNQLVGANIVAGYGTNAVITFTSTIGGTLPEHLYAIYSLNNGLTWSSRVRIDDAVSPDNSQKPNRVSASMDMTNGHVDVAWYDSRNKNGAVGMGDVYYSYSNNTGQSFATNLRLTHPIVVVLFKIAPHLQPVGMTSGFIPTPVTFRSCSPLMIPPKALAIPGAL